MFLFTPEGVSVMTVILMGWMWRLRLSGIVPFDPGELQTRQPGALRPRCPEDVARVWSHPQLQPGVSTSRNRHKSVDAEVSRHPPDHTTGIFASFASTQPFACLSPTSENGITVFIPGEAVSTAA